MPTKLNDWMPEKTEREADWELWRVPNLPNRSRATMSGHRSAAQNGQYSEPTKSTSGRPPCESGGCPLRTTGAVSVVPGTVTPTESKVEGVTPARVATTSAEVTDGRATLVGVVERVRA